LAQTIVDSGNEVGW